MSSAAVYSIAVLPGGDLVAGGSFETVGGVLADSVARWNGTSWSAFGSGMCGVVVALTVMPGGDLVACSGRTIARRSGGSWSVLGFDFDDIWAAAALPGGDLVVAGGFTSIAGVPANHIARWNGTSWSPLGAGTDDLVMSLLALPDGSVVAAGNFTHAGGILLNHVARWDGANWSALGGTGSIYVDALARLPGGDLIAGSTSGVSRWNGTAWSAVGSGLGTVKAVAVLPGGDLVAAGDGFIVQWNGSAWSLLGVVPGTVCALAVLPSGDLVAAGAFATVNGVQAYNIARWGGSAWRPVATGVQGQIAALATLADGDLVAGGGFLATPNNVSAYVVRLTTTCAASVTAFGNSCNGPSGPVTLTADSLPWTGSVFRTTATGLSPAALAFGVVGFSSPAVPLSLIHPAGLPGCDLLASTDLVLFLVPSAGTASCQFLLPASAVWAGTLLNNQVVQLELDPQFALVSISSSNALSLRVGTF
jgi:hypothetical protein